MLNANVCGKLPQCLIDQEKDRKWEKERLLRLRNDKVSRTIYRSKRRGKASRLNPFLGVPTDSPSSNRSKSYSHLPSAMLRSPYLNLFDNFNCSCRSIRKKILTISVSRSMKCYSRNNCNIFWTTIKVEFVMLRKLT